MQFLRDPSQIIEYEAITGYTEVGRTYVEKFGSIGNARNERNRLTLLAPGAIIYISKYRTSGSFVQDCSARLGVFMSVYACIIVSAYVWCNRKVGEGEFW